VFFSENPRILADAKELINDRSIFLDHPGPKYFLIVALTSFTETGCC